VLNNWTIITSCRSEKHTHPAPSTAPSLLHQQKNACVTLRLPPLPLLCTSVSSRLPQAPARVHRETWSVVALAHSAALPEHDPTTSKPPAQRHKPPPLLSLPTPLHVAPPTARTCCESQVWVVANPGPPWNPNFGTLLPPLRNPNFGTLLQPLRNPSFGTMLTPLRNPSFGMLLQPLQNPSFETLLSPQFSCLVN